MTDTPNSHFLRWEVSSQRPYLAVGRRFSCLSSHFLMCCGLIEGGDEVNKKVALIYREIDKTFGRRGPRTHVLLFTTYKAKDYYENGEHF